MHHPEQADPSAALRISLADSRFGCAYAHARKAAQVVKDRCELIRFAHPRLKIEGWETLGSVALGPLTHIYVSRLKNYMGGRVWEEDSVKSASS